MDKREKWRLANKDQYRRWAGRRYRRNLTFLNRWKAAAGCIDCAYTDPRALDFDHVFGTKAFSIGTAAGQCSGLPRLIKEIAKCVVRCANCHRIATAERKS